MEIAPTPAFPSRARSCSPPIATRSSISALPPQRAQHRDQVAQGRRGRRRVRQRMARRGRHPGGHSGRPLRGGPRVDRLRHLARRRDVLRLEDGDPRVHRRGDVQGQQPIRARRRRQDAARDPRQPGDRREEDPRRAFVLAGKVGRAVEEFLVGKIQSNLVETAKGLAKYLEERTTRPTRRPGRTRTELTPTQSFIWSSANAYSSASFSTARAARGRRRRGPSASRRGGAPAPRSTPTAARRRTCARASGRRGRRCRR